MKIFFKKFNNNKIKEVGLVSLAFVLIGIGYINFAKNENVSVETYAKSTNSLGDVELVSSNAILVENNEQIEDENENINKDKIEDKKENESNDKIENVNSNIEEEKQEIDNQSQNDIEVLNNENKEYFSEIKLNRNIMYDESIETYQKIIDSNTISSQQKSIAVQEIEKITKQKNSISIAEELIKLKGFKDIVILVNGDNANAIVNVAHLTKSEVVQIQNIIMKELGVNIQNISISTK